MLLIWFHYDCTLRAYLENDLDGFLVCDTPTEDESSAGLKFFLKKQVVDDAHLVWWVFHNQPKKLEDLGFKFRVRLISWPFEDDEDINDIDCPSSFEGAVLPCEATAETVMENGLGLVLDMDYVRGEILRILSGPQFDLGNPNRMGVTAILTVFRLEL